jgi:release factor glutamine methyltransferase
MMNAPALTIIYSDRLAIVVADPGVYPPQYDSRLLIEALQKTNLAPGRHVLDLCTGSGVVAVAAAQLGASSAIAFDICPRAVRCSRANAESAGVQVNVQIGSLTDALARGPFDVVVCNPPYVPTGPETDSDTIPPEEGPRGPGMPATTVAWCSTRCAPRRRTCLPTAALC